MGASAAPTGLLFVDVLISIEQILAVWPPLLTGLTVPIGPV